MENIETKNQELRKNSEKNRLERTKKLMENAFQEVKDILKTLENGYIASANDLELASSVKEETLLMNAYFNSITALECLKSTISKRFNEYYIDWEKFEREEAMEAQRIVEANIKRCQK